MFKRKRHITVIPGGGLCNRMQFLSSCAILSKDDLSIKCLWYKNSECYISTRDLFSAESRLFGEMRIVEIDEHILPERLFYLLFIKICRLIEILSDQLEFYHRDEEESKTLEEREYDYAELMISKSRARVFVGYEKLSDEYDQGMFVPKQQIANLANAVSVDHHRESYVSIHIRRFDLNDGKPLGIRYLECVERVIETVVDSGEKIFVACDDLKYKQELIAKFGHNNIITRQLDSYRRSDIQGIIDAYVDLLCLSRGKMIYGNENSSFSRMAAIMGEIELIDIEGMT